MLSSKQVRSECYFKVIGFSQMTKVKGWTGSTLPIRKGNLHDETGFVDCSFQPFVQGSDARYLEQMFHSV